MKRSVRSILAGIGAAAMLSAAFGVASAQAASDDERLLKMNWDEILKEARGQTVRWWMWAGDAGVNQYGRFCVSALGHGALDGTGARSYQDGVDSWGGHLSCANVEWFEMNFPVLYLFRRHARDGAGAGKFRGGAGAETAHTLHDAPEGKLKGVTYGVAGLRNSGQGIFGGYPGAPSIVVLLEDTRVRDLIQQNQCVEEMEDLGGKSRLLGYSEFDLRKNDVLYMRVACGGGYGDPLERDPQLVAGDVANGVFSKETARDIYGVVLDEQGELDPAATEGQRAVLREERAELKE